MIKFLRRDKGTLPPPEPSESARKAYEESQARLSQILQRWPEVIGVVGSLKQAREENNFEARIRATLTGGTE